MVSATLTTADSQGLMFSPNISGGSPSQFDQTRLPEKSGSAIKQDDDSTKWTKFPQVPFTDFDWASVDRDFRKNSGGNGLKNSKDLTLTGESANSNEKIFVWQYLLQNPNTKEPSVTLADRLCIG
jgi:hypothetical protein